MTPRASIILMTLATLVVCMFVGQALGKTRAVCFELNELNLWDVKKLNVIIAYSIQESGNLKELAERVAKDLASTSKKLKGRELLAGMSISKLLWLNGWNPEIVCNDNGREFREREEVCKKFSSRNSEIPFGQANLSDESHVRLAIGAYCWHVYDQMIDSCKPDVFEIALAQFEQDPDLDYDKDYKLLQGFGKKVSDYEIDRMHSNLLLLTSLHGLVVKALHKIDDQSSLKRICAKVVERFDPIFEDYQDMISNRGLRTYKWRKFNEYCKLLARHFKYWKPLV